MKRFVSLAALSIGLLVPGTVSAQWTIGTPCAGSTLQSCVEFQIEHVGSLEYEFSVTYLSSLAADPGILSAFGIYDVDGAPVFSLTNATFLSATDGGDWTAYTNSQCHLTGDGEGAGLFEACADADPPPAHNGLTLGHTATFSFTSNLEILPEHFTVAGGLGARAHVTGFGSEEADCSFKLDTRINGQFSGPDEFGGDIDQCGAPVPEPASALLLGSGLFALGVAAVRRRRNGLDIEHS